jgi:flagellar assembly factor FliW
MVQILSQRLGAISLDEAAILLFPAGLPGFEHCTRFALLERPAAAPIVFLQSLDRPEVCFLAAPVTEIDPAYQLAMTQEDLNCIGIPSAKDVLCLAILAPAEDGRFTANLLAPVVIDRKTRRAVQAVRVDSRYSHQHPLAAEESRCS